MPRKYYSVGKFDFSWLSRGINKEIYSFKQIFQKFCILFFDVSSWKNYFLKIQHDSKRAPLFETCKLKYNCEHHDEIFINFKKLKSILKQFTAEDIAFTFLPDDLECCLTNDEENEENIKTYLVGNFFLWKDI